MNLFVTFVITCVCAGVATYVLAVLMALVTDNIPDPENKEEQSWME